MPDWIAELHARGLARIALSVLEVLEPFGPLGAQALYVGGPLAGLFGWKVQAEALAGMLEAPDGIERLRGWLETAPPGRT